MSAGTARAGGPWPVREPASSDPPAARRRARTRPSYPAEDRRRVMRAVWLDSTQSWKLRFSVMLALSVVIASIGLIADSPAVVIGAMLIAPLMTPVLGFAVALSMGWARLMLRAAATVSLASVGSIALAWLLASVLPTPASPLTPEVVSRTAPTVLDLLVALAAGAAGSYATLREDVSAALPGVAVAVALVPPLAAVGVTLQLGQSELVKGAALLYLANLVAIVLAGVAVLLVSGFVPLPRLSQVRHRVVGSTAAAMAATVAVAVLLSGDLRDTVDSATTLKAVNDEVIRWLGPQSDLEVRHISVDGADVLVELAGSTPPPPTSALAGGLVDAVGPDASVRVRWSQRTSQTAPVTVVPGPTVAPAQAEVFRPLAEAWLSAAGVGGAASVTSLSLHGDELVVEIDGPSAPPQARSLATAVAAERGKHTKVTVRWTPRQEFAASSDSGPSATDAAARTRRIVDGWAAARPGVVVLATSVTGGVATVDLAAEQEPLDVATLVAAVRSQVGVDTVVRLAPLRRLSAES